MANFGDNQKFWESLKEYKEQREYAEEHGLPEPPIPEYAGECIMLISQNLARRPNFRNYTFVEDMIGDGIEMGIKKIKKFDPERTQKPFSYFTMIVWRSFLNRIRLESTQTKIKKKQIENAMIDLADIVEGDMETDQLSLLQEEALNHFTK